MAKKSRKLVEISTEKHEALTKLRDNLARTMRRAPSIPDLVDEALQYGIPLAKERHAQH